MVLFREVAATAVRRTVLCGTWPSMKVVTRVIVIVIVRVRVMVRAVVVRAMASAAVRVTARVTDTAREFQGLHAMHRACVRVCGRVN